MHLKLEIGDCKNLGGNRLGIGMKYGGDAEEEMGPGAGGWDWSWELRFGNLGLTSIRMRLKPRVRG
jgi:hypothetical protein